MITERLVALVCPLLGVTACPLHRAAEVVRCRLAAEVTECSITVRWLAARPKRMYRSRDSGGSLERRAWLPLDDGKSRPRYSKEPLCVLGNLFRCRL